MTDLDRGFVDVVRPDVQGGNLSPFLRLALLVGPPEGVDPECAEVAGVMREASARFPNAEVHEDWHAIWAELASR